MTEVNEPDETDGTSRDGAGVPSWLPDHLHPVDEPAEVTEEPETPSRPEVGDAEIVGDTLDKAAGPDVAPPRWQAPSPSPSAPVPPAPPAPPIPGPSVAPPAAPVARTPFQSPPPVAPRAAVPPVQPAPAAAPTPFGAPPAGVPVSPQDPSSKKPVIFAALGLFLLLIIGGVIAAVTLSNDDDQVDAGDAAVATTEAPPSTDVVNEPEPTSDLPPEEVVDPGEPLSAEDLSRSVVQIQLLLQGQPVCTGSGTIIDDQGTIVTNFHVIEQSPFCPHDRIGIAIAERSSAPPELRYEADLLSFDADLDLAVVRIERNIDGSVTNDSFEALEIGDSDLVELGEELSVIGYPGIGGETVTFTTGSVSGFAETAEGGQRSWIKTDATIAGGNSGGLAADSDGRFVGIPTRVGTNSNQVVDCRVLADSNGDGVLNGQDTCVPIGGFINGIRPVALALPLIEAAQSASPINQGDPFGAEPMDVADFILPSNPVWTSALDGGGAATDVLFAGQAGIPELCLTWEYQDVPSGSPSEVNWFQNQTAIPSASGTAEIVEVDGSLFACIADSDGLPAGVYEMFWLVNGELVFAEAILLDAGETAVIEVVNESVVPLCAVQFNPNGTRTYGLNELIGTLDPGDSVVFTVHVGRLDTLIIDCNGEPRIEDPSGFEVVEDLIVRVN